MPLKIIFHCVNFLDFLKSPCTYHDNFSVSRKYPPLRQVFKIAEDAKLGLMMLELDLLMVKVDLYQLIYDANDCFKNKFHVRHIVEPWEEVWWAGFDYPELIGCGVKWQLIYGVSWILMCYTRDRGVKWPSKW